MIKSFIKSLLLVALLTVCLPEFASAAPPHNVGSDCSRCHISHKSLGWEYNNICLNCHRFGSSDPKYGQITPFVVTDQASVDGPSQGKLKGKALQSSHKWEGSDDKPKVGAQAPTNAYLLGWDITNANTNNKLSGKLYCDRCHSVHGHASAVYPGTVNPPFLRIDNSQDGMCLDCHKVRNKVTQAEGTHPVTVTYATVATAKPNEYRATPQNSNPANSTSAMKIISGKVLCSTCHGIHASDSNSRTLDNYSSIVLGALSSSQGYLLRTDMRGSSASAINICTNCHITTDENPNAKVKSHNGSAKQQNIQCTDCHGAHVDENDSSLINKHLIKRYMNYSSVDSNNQSGKRPVFFTETSLSKRNYNGANGVCIACHRTLPSGAGKPAEHTSSNPTDCVKCHTHKNGFSADCTSCHGMPPASNTVGEGGKAAGYTGVDESTSPHKSHAGGLTNYSFGCEQCHQGNNHNSASFQDVFINKAGIRAGAAAVYSASTTRNCSTTYCHSDGNGNYATVSWNTVITQPAACNACHAAQPVTGSHSQHIASGYSCTNCHSNTVSDNTTIKPDAKTGSGTHTNGTKDKAFGGLVGSVTLTGSDCSNVYCHSNGKGTYSSPVWGSSATGACGTCHMTSNAVETGTNAHYAHMSATYGPNLNSLGYNSQATCATCHTAYPVGHLNGATPAPANSTCTTNCHKGDFPTWTLSGSANRLDCATCHTAGTLSVISGVSAPAKAGTLFTVEGHGKYTVQSAAVICTTCHDNTTPHINGILGDAKRIKFALGTGNTACNYCHTDANIVTNSAYRNMSTHFTTYGGNGNMECVVCHDIHGTTNAFSIKSFITFNSMTATVSFPNHISADSFVNDQGRGLCQVCHTYTDFYKRNAVGESHNRNTNCLDCHKHNTNKGAFAAIAGGCSGCHGYPPIPKDSVRMATTDPAYTATLQPTSPLYKKTYGFSGNYSSAKFEDYTGGGAAHLNHVPTGARPEDAWKHCSACHSKGETIATPGHTMKANLKSGSTGVTIDINPAFSFNGNAAQIMYSSARFTAMPANKTGSCVNISCHFQPSPKWSNKN